MKMLSPSASAIIRTKPNPVREALEQWCREKETELIGSEPALPEGIVDRTADCWEPLVAIADVAGNDWPKRARDAAIYLSSRATDETSTSGVQLLAHVREAFSTDDKIWTATLLQRLWDRDELPWKEIVGGNWLGDRGLSTRLKHYGIKSKDVRLGETVRKGYDAADFADAWKRYLPHLPESATRATSATDLSNQNNFVADVADVYELPNVIPFPAIGYLFFELKDEFLFKLRLVLG